jgi:hypothetical protein
LSPKTIEWWAWTSRLKDYPISILTGRPRLPERTFEPEFEVPGRNVTSPVDRSLARVLLLIG